MAGPRNKFFPPLAHFDPPYPIAPDGYLPNSAILQQLRKSEEDRLLAERWRPPTLSDKQRKLMEEMKQVGELFLISKLLAMILAFCACHVTFV